MKKLNDDILEKNTLRNEIEGYVQTVSKWRDKLADLKSFQGQTKYADSIKRYVTKIEGLRVELNELNEEVEKNIRETGKFADADVKAFSSQLDQEVSKYIGETEKKASKKKIKIKPNPAQAKKKSKAKEIPLLSSIVIKKMKPPALKEALSERGLPTQGNKKDLIKRLTAHEKERE